MNHSASSSALAVAMRQANPLAPQPAPFDVPTTRGTGMRMRALPRMPHSRRFMGAANMNNNRGDIGPAKQIIQPLRMKRLALKAEGKYDVSDLAEKQALANISTTKRHIEPNTRRRLPVHFGETKRAAIHDAAIDAFGGADNLPKVQSRPQQTLALNSSVLDAHSSLIPREPDHPLPQLISSTNHVATQSTDTPHEPVVHDVVTRVELPITVIQPSTNEGEKEEPMLEWMYAGVEGRPQHQVDIGLAANPNEIQLRKDTMVVDAGALHAVSLPLAQQNIWAEPAGQVDVVGPRPTDGLLAPLRHDVQGRALVAVRQEFAGVEQTSLPSQHVEPVLDNAPVMVREVRLLREAGEPGLVPLSGLAVNPQPVTGEEVVIVRDQDPLAGRTVSMDVHTGEPELVNLTPSFAGVEFTQADVPHLPMGDTLSSHDPTLDNSMTFRPTLGLPGSDAQHVKELGTAIQHDVLSEDDPLLGTYRPPQGVIGQSDLDVDVKNPVHVQNNRPSLPSLPAWSPWQTTPISHLTQSTTADGVAGGLVALGDEAVPAHIAIGNMERPQLGAARAVARTQQALDLSPDVRPFSPPHASARLDTDHSSLPAFAASTEALEAINNSFSPKRTRQLSIAQRRLR